MAKGVKMVSRLSVFCLAYRSEIKKYVSTVTTYFHKVDSLPAATISELILPAVEYIKIRFKVGVSIYKYYNTHSIMTDGRLYTSLLKYSAMQSDTHWTTVVVNIHKVNQLLIVHTASATDGYTG